MIGRLEDPQGEVTMARGLHSTNTLAVAESLPGTFAARDLTDVQIFFVGHHSRILRGLLKHRDFPERLRRAGFFPPAERSVRGSPSGIGRQQRHCSDDQDRLPCRTRSARHRRRCRHCRSHAGGPEPCRPNGVRSRKGHDRGAGGGSDTESRPVCSINAKPGNPWCGKSKTCSDFITG